MIFAFVEGGTLEVYATTADAQREFEGIDVESGVVHFYDEHGTPLEPRFVTPNRRGRWLGVLGWVSSGSYELIANPGWACDSFALALHETVCLDPNPWFTSLEQLKSVLASRGVATEHRPAERA